MKSAGAEAAAEVWTVRRVLSWAAGDLQKRGSSSPRLDAELLLGRVLGMDRIGLIMDAQRPLEKTELAGYRELHQRRRAGEPVAYLLGVREFYGRPFRVDQRVLIPRPDTETLVEAALHRTRSLSMCARVLDMCTGSGCIAISLARERPTTPVLGLDISDDAIAVARENALRLGAVNAAFIVSDLFAALGGTGARFDLITANPPYIADAEIALLAVDIRAFEPRLALSGGPDGLVVIRRIVQEAPAWLAPGGILAVEVAAGQAESARRMFAARGFSALQFHRDYAGHDRVVSGQWSLSL